MRAEGAPFVESQLLRHYVTRHPEATPRDFVEWTARIYDRRNSCMHAYRIELAAGAPPRAVLRKAHSGKHTDVTVEFLIKESVFISPDPATSLAMATTGVAVELFAATCVLPDLVPWVQWYRRERRENPFREIFAVQHAREVLARYGGKLP